MRPVSIKRAIMALISVVLLAIPAGFGCGGAQDEPQFPVPTSPPIPNEMAHEPMPVVLLSGTEYEMGYQYGQQLGEYLEAVKQQCWNHIGDTMERDAVVETLGQLASLTEENLPDVDFLDRFRGIAQGAQDAGYDITYEDALLCAFRGQVVMLVEDNLCSCVAAWGGATADGETIAGVNYDFGHRGTNYYEVAVVAYPDNANAYVTHGIAGKLGDNFIMNDKGLVMGMNMNPGFSEEEAGYETTAWCLFPYVAMVSSTAQEARDVVVDKFTGWGINWLIADVNGDACAVETSTTITSEREPGDFGEQNYIITTNFCLNPEMGDASRTPSYGDRYTTLAQSVQDNYGQVDADMVMDMMTEVQLSMTLVSKVAIPEDKTVYFCHGLPGEGGWAAGADAPTGQYVKIQMGDSVQSTAENMRQSTWAALTLIQENTSIKGTAWANEKLEQLKEKYEQGVEYYGAGCAETDVNDACGNFGKACTLFSQVQAGASYLADLFA